MIFITLRTLNGTLTDDRGISATLLRYFQMLHCFQMLPLPFYKVTFGTLEHPG